MWDNLRLERPKDTVILKESNSDIRFWKMAKRYNYHAATNFEALEAAYIPGLSSLIELRGKSLVPLVGWSIT